MKTILVDAYNTLVTDEGINADMLDMLEQFDNPKIVLTNADDEKQIELWLVDMPYEMFTLNFNPKKDTPEYYEIFLEKYNFSPDDVVYFEHNADAVDSAKSIGIPTFHYNKEDKNIEEVKDFLQAHI